MSVIVVLCTVPTEEHARQIARTLVEERLAACVSVLPGLRSFYRWEGDLCDDAEILLLIKARRELFDALARRLHELHPYQVPEIVALEAAAVAPAYLAWLRESTGL
jgi:periplasmic divalent cation tolerance protein